MCVIVDMVTFTKRKYLFRLFGRSLQCKCFATVRDTSVSLSYLTWESLQDRGLCALWFLSNMTIFLSCQLHVIEKKRGLSGHYYYSCYKVITGTNLFCCHSTTFHVAKNG